MNEIEVHMIAMLQASKDIHSDITMIPRHKETNDPIGLVFVTTDPETIEIVNKFLETI